MSGRDARDRAPRVKNRAPAAVQVCPPPSHTQARSDGLTTSDHRRAALAGSARSTGTELQGAQAEGAGYGGVDRVSGTYEERVRVESEVFEGGYPG
jgi:hypothetical protein